MTTEPARPPIRLRGRHWLTHYGSRGEFYEQPRVDRDGAAELELSMTLGPTDVHVMALLVRGSSAHSRDRVRFFQVGALQEHGYQVVHTPTEGNGLHVSVSAPGNGSAPPDTPAEAQQEEARKWWNSQERTPLMQLAARTIFIEESGHARAYEAVDGPRSTSEAEGTS